MAASAPSRTTPGAVPAEHDGLRCRAGGRHVHPLAIDPGLDADQVARPGQGGRPSDRAERQALGRPGVRVAPRGETQSVRSVGSGRASARVASGGGARGGAGHAVGVRQRHPDLVGRAGLQPEQAAREVCRVDAGEGMGGAPGGLARRPPLQGRRGVALGVSRDRGHHAAGLEIPVGGDAGEGDRCGLGGSRGAERQAGQCPAAGGGTRASRHGGTSSVRWAGLRFGDARIGCQRRRWAGPVSPRWRSTAVELEASARIPW